MKQLEDNVWMQQCKHAMTGDVPTRKFAFDSGWVLELCGDCVTENRKFWQSQPVKVDMNMSVSRRRSIAMKNAWIRRRKMLKDLAEQKELRAKIAARSKPEPVVHLKRRPHAPHNGGSWTAAEDEVVSRYYRDTSNFGQGGRIKQGAMKTIIRMLGRTKGAIQMRSVALGFNLAQRQALLHPQPPAKKFPVFRDASGASRTATAMQLIEDALRRTVKMKRGKLLVTEAAALGINSQKDWAELKSDVIMNSNKIADFFKVDNKFRLENNAICYDG